MQIYRCCWENGSLCKVNIPKRHFCRCTWFYKFLQLMFIFHSNMTEKCLVKTFDSFQIFDGNVILELGFDEMWLLQVLVCEREVWKRKLK